MDRNTLLNDANTSHDYALTNLQSRMWTALICTVREVDLTRMTVSAQPCIQGTMTNEEGANTFVNLPLLVDVPICFPSAGGFLLTLPIAIGDEVLVVLASRCIDSWWELGCENPPYTQVPMEDRMHDLSDAFAIPGPRSQVRIPSGSISSTHAQLRNDAGTVYLEITSGGAINMVAPGGVNITGALVVSGEITGNGIPLSTHTHPVTTAPGETGAPVA